MVFVKSFYPIPLQFLYILKIIRGSRKYAIPLISDAVARTVLILIVLIVFVLILIILVLVLIVLILVVLVILAVAVVVLIFVIHFAILLAIRPE